MIPDMQRLQEDIYDWAEDNFPQRTNEQQIKKLRGEINELEKNYLETGAATPGEIADCLHLILDMASRSGIDAYSATREKLSVNKQRTWAQQPDGTFQHIKIKPVRCAQGHNHEGFDSARTCNQRAAGQL